MQAAGIIAEYNPFHGGHRHHIEETRRLLPGAAIVCFMSGSFVQRGEPALLHKTARAKAAVQCGADLVFELPVSAVLSPAERFAFAGVALAKACGFLTHLSFGCECGDLALLQQAADAADSEETHAARSALLKQGYPYPFAAAAALPPPLRPVMQSPNNLLGIEYLRAIKRQSAALTPVAIPRKGAPHDAPEEDGKPAETSAPVEAGKPAEAGAFLSASALRKIYREGRNPSPGALPMPMAAAIEEERSHGRFPVMQSALDTAVLAALRRATLEELALLPEVSEGLENRLYQAARRCYTVDDLLASVKTRRYSLARLRRCLMACLLGLTKEAQQEPPAYLRVLAVSEPGRGLLARMRKTSALPVVTKPAALLKLSGPAAAQAQREALADDLYALAFPNPAAGASVSFFTATPYRHF